MREESNTLTANCYQLPDQRSVTANKFYDILRVLTLLSARARKECAANTCLRL